jgi:molybdopterin-containing oxidoreductase family iron-sulfur binding subunit
MGINRREFLKVAGFSTLLGLGAKAAFELLAPGEIEAALEAVPLTAGKKWGMVLDMTKMDEKVMNKAIEACHRTHNVPKVENRKQEIKWIWKETYEHTFLSSCSAITARTLPAAGYAPQKPHGREKKTVW